MAVKKSSPKHLLISVVSPVYRAEAILETFVERVIDAVTKITKNYEIILVDDGSPDHSWEKIRSICLKNPRVKGIKLSRNFGQHSAIGACFEHSQGDYVVLMDCDLQDNPAYIPEMYKLFDGSIDYVLSRRQSKKQSFLRGMIGKSFYKIYNWLSGTQYDGNIGPLSMLSRKFIDAYLRFGAYQRIYFTTLHWIGFKGKVMDVQTAERFSGSSSYNISKLIRVGLNMIVANSDRLLNLSVIIGLAFMAVSFLSAFSIFLSITLFGVEYASGWPSVIVLILFCTGLILLSMGVTGLYIGKIFEQVKNLPRYIVQDTLNL
jgi:polyisoprenyl-phosphate glycosyltransferase